MFVKCPRGQIKLKLPHQHYKEITREWGGVTKYTQGLSFKLESICYYLFYRMPLSTQFFQNDNYSNLALDLFKALGGLQTKA